MSKDRKKSEATQRCRACLLTGNEMYQLQDEYNFSSKKVHNLLGLLQACASVQISLNEKFPQYLCKKCLEKANISYQFKLQCEYAEIQLHLELEAKDKCLYDSDPGELNSKLERFSNEINNFASTDLAHTIKNVKNYPNNGESSKHIGGSSQSQSDSGIFIKQHICDQCGKEFKYRASMIKHKHKHDVIACSCTYCTDSFLNATLLARHMEQVHAHLKTLKCSECSKAFFKRANLRLHMNVHSGIKRHMCEVCGTSFALAGNLAAHRRLHTGSKPYTCNQCGRGFTQQAALRSHEASHSNKKDHICSVCGAAFSRAGALRNHCKRHLALKPFVCSLCNKAFTFSSERKRHMTIHTGEKNHECDICGSRFNRSTNLAVHRRIHTGETPHVCLKCGKRFSQAHCLQTHMGTHF